MFGFAKQIANVISIFPYALFFITLILILWLFPINTSNIIYQKTILSAIYRFI